MSMTRLLPLALFLHAVVFSALGPAANAQTFGAQPFAETYLVEAVPAKASADNPLAARDAALAKAQREALDILLKRLVGPGGEGSLPVATDQLVFQTMLGFEVKEEKTSATTYSALISVSPPLNTKGSRTGQWAVTGWPGHTGQTSPAVLSQTVMTISIAGTPGAAAAPNSSQLLLRRPVVGRPRLSSRARLWGLT